MERTKVEGGGPGVKGTTVVMEDVDKSWSLEMNMRTLGSTRFGNRISPHNPGPVKWSVWEA
ncbi:hypothetical protein I7I50_00962 [Histoplasma capsulatum G186AR]|uniref:Uncharacterized protein n=1 Tax=Ajellomyces capsulatus TaxID=5037 RepID=A0A8H7YK45_AJECA|nr:hypothetical protein I7I52_08228 [Histoplasma capsulatum]QSS72957.1 hypothetical protein I7I50_00962 [Histoplasma capsulatum G186AR]